MQQQKKHKDLAIESLLEEIKKPAKTNFDRTVRLKAIQLLIKIEGLDKNTSPEEPISPLRIIVHEREKE